MYADIAVVNHIDNFIRENDELVSEIEQFLEVEQHAVLFESFKDSIKVLINKAIEFFKKIKRAFDNFILNLNYFKEAKVYIEMDNDIKTILEMLDPSMNMKYIDTINNCFLDLYSKRKHPYLEKVPRNKLDNLIPDKTGTGVSDKTELLMELKDIAGSTTDIIDRVKSSEEYSRLISNKYSGNSAIISLGSVIEDTKNCKNRIFELTGLLSKLNNTINNEQLNFGISNVIRKCIEYYTLRIDILNYYFKNVKYNLKMFKYNRSSISNGKSSALLTIDTSEIYPDKNICELVSLLEGANSQRDFVRYKNIYKSLCEELGVSENYDIRFFTDIRKLSPNSKVKVEKLLNDYKKVNIYKRNLYHHEFPKCIGESPRDIIYPSAIGNNHTTLYAEPRIYFFMDLAFNKNGEIVKYTSFNFSNGYIYKLITNEKVGYRDPWFMNRISGSGSAAFMITDKGVKAEVIKSIDYYESDKRNIFK